MPETIYYDGNCGLCHGFVKFVVARDPHERFHFAPLASLPAAERERLPDSIVVKSAGGVLVKSDAALYVVNGLGGLWRLVAAIARIFPRFVRDAVYDQIARVRYRVFGKRTEMCPLVPPRWRGRFEA